MLQHLIDRSSDLNQTFLKHVLGPQDNTSKRKRRLFEVACCRRIAQLMIDERSISAVDAAERFADGKCDADELDLFLLDANRAIREIENSREPESRQDPWRPAPPKGYQAVMCAACAASGVAYRGPLIELEPCSVDTAKAAALADQRPYETALADEMHAQCQLIHDIFGNPFQPVRIPGEALTWRQGIVPLLAAAIYEYGLFEFVPLISRLLQCAGFNCEEAVEHGSSQPVHVRGCWLIDVLLGFA